MNRELLQLSHLTKHYPMRGGIFGRARGSVHAVDDVSFAIAEGETLGLVGESGCGKSTIGKTVLRLVLPTAGTIEWRGQRIDQLAEGAMRANRRRACVRRISSRSRFATSRTSTQPPFATVSPRCSNAWASLFVAHDLAVVEHISHRVAMMYLGRIVEIAPKRALFQMPRHPYTEALLSAVPIRNPTVQKKRIILAGDVPSPIDLPKGCRFHTRCPYAFDRCRVEEPKLLQVWPEHFAACHLREAPPLTN